ncbi:hypothetical protein OQA88_2373 [Cercophora sp. LCS_1]
MLIPTPTSFLLPFIVAFSALTLAAPSPPTPRRTLAGISVTDTPVARAAQAYAQQHCSPGTYQHVMRTWLFGVFILSHNTTLASRIDLEVHALGLILHDLATHHSLDAPFVSLDRRFEVDSAVAAADFIRAYDPKGKDWPSWRIQKVWDGIALHAEPSIALHKEADVFAIYWGNELEFSFGRQGGERMGVTEEEYERVHKEFPSPEEGGGGGGGGILGFVAWYSLCKPESTYNTWMQPYGELLVEGYSAVGHRVLDLSLAAAGLNVSELGKRRWMPEVQGESWSLYRLEDDEYEL